MSKDETTPTNITVVVDAKSKEITSRAYAFDFCYNYFIDFYKTNNLEFITCDYNVEKSAAMLFSYLGNGGMLRGSSYLPQKNQLFMVPLLDQISNLDPYFWEIDVNTYDDDSIDYLIYAAGKLSLELHDGHNEPSDTLITKIMLGVAGNVPVFDQYVRKALGVNGFNRSALRKVKQFYDENQDFLHNNEIYTIDFLTGKDTDVRYPIAKLVDMHGYAKGYEMIEQKKIRKLEQAANQ